MKNNDTEEEKITLIIGDNDSELIERLKEIIEKEQDSKKEKYL